MAGFTTVVANKVLDHLMANAAWTMPAGVYVALHIADPGETGANELTGGSYSRQSASFDTAAGSATYTLADLLFSSLPACEITHVSLWDQVSGGTCMASGPFTAKKTVPAGGSLRIRAGDLDALLV